MNKEPEKLIFFHIHKTSGTTFASILRKNYNPEKIARCYGNAPSDIREAWTEEAISQEIGAAVRRNDDVIMGHFGWSKIDGSTSENYKTLTFLREPTDRWISEYLHIQRSDREDHKRLVATLPDVESRLSHPNTQNLQCKFLSSVACDPDDTNMDKVYESARYNLRKRLDVLGITEHFGDSIVIFRYALGWRRTGYKRRNLNPVPTYATQLRQDYAERLEAANAYDIELYNEALSLFERRIDSTPMFGQRKLLLSATRQLARRSSHPMQTRGKLPTRSKTRTV